MTRNGGIKDITWQESEVHDDDNSDDECYETSFQLFSTPSSANREGQFDTFTYNFVFQKHQFQPYSDPPYRFQHQINLYGHAEINNSTGLSIWSGSEILAQFLIDNPHYIANNQVLELGSGTGLCGISCHYIGAKRVILTDGDLAVLKNLRMNVARNVDHSFCDCDTILDHVNSTRSSNAGVDSTTCTVAATISSPDITMNTVSCPQHIWGKGIPDFIRSYGKSNVIIATDCVYIPQSLEPFWQSIDQLLVSNDSSMDSNNMDDGGGGSSINEGIFIYTNRCSSSATIERVLEMATRYGFTWTTEDDGEDLRYGIYIFTRAR